MRTLKFIVTDNVITEDPNCSFTGLFPSAELEIRAEFTFSQEWDKYIKVAAFWSIMGTEYPPQLLDEENSCMIPTEALMKPAFRVEILGANLKQNIKTKPLTIYQKGGKQ